MSETTNKAVFLSYASQDAEAAKRICDALRAAGVEVWFDQSELRGGDAWDGKIRKQIKDCALFMPVITPNTNARPEGYFRLEWKLAVDRSHLMADDQPFLFPIVVGDVSDAAARVPDRFREVQWTRLRLDETPAELAGRVTRLLSGNVEPVGVPRPRDRDGSGMSGHKAPPTKTGLEKWWWLIFPIMGMSVPIIGLLKGRAPHERPASPAVAAATPPGPGEAAQPAGDTPAAADPRRVALARFENLTGDASLDHIARVIESELTRGLGTMPSIRLVPLEAAGRAEARTAAREARASSVIVGSYLKRGDKIELSAEIVLAAEGEVFGAVGPAVVATTDLRGPGLTEFVDRLTTGAHNAAVTLQNPPTRMAAMTYRRPWPRWSVVSRAQQIRQAETSKPEEVAAVIQQYRDLLEEAPELLKIKHDLARVLMFNGRHDEAQKLFRELLAPDRGQLSEQEILAITYDDALLAGDPARAIMAARGQLEIRPMGDAITQVLACLWAQNRPREAFNEFDAWWKRYGMQLPEVARPSTEQGLYATEALMHLQEGKPAEALATIERLHLATAGRRSPSAYWLKFFALSALGREAEQWELLTDSAAQSTGSRVEPVNLCWQGYILALHGGRPEEARRWLAATLKAWDDLPAATRDTDQYLSLAVWLHEAAGRPAESLKAIELLAVRYPDLANAIGARAVVLTAQGRADEAAPLVRRLEEWDPRNARGLPAYWRARLAVRAGDKARAVELLRQAVAGGLWFGGFNSPTFEYGRSEPEFAVLRGYEPYEQLLQPKG